MDDSHLVKEEENIVEQIKEWLWESQVITDHINKKVQFYWADAYGIDMKGQKTDFQEEFVCQCQVQLMQALLAKVMVA